jgi:membrane protein DedA with SNARE-associated domain
MSLETLVATYGYPVLLLGILCEGETILVVASFLAHRGYLKFSWVVVIAFSGTMALDQSLFHLGRWKGIAFLQRRPSWQRRVGRVRDLLDRHQTSLVTGFRFLYGLRTVSPLVIGMSGFGSVRFAVLNAIGAAAWVGVVGGGGYVFGEVLESVISNVKKYELWVLSALVVVGCAARLIQRKRFK